jgi:hypothetical protein
MRGMSDLAGWRSRAADPDVASAASVWADTAAPRTVLAAPSKVVVDYLVNAGAADGTLRDVLHNPAVSDSVRAALARRATGQARTAIARYATDPDRDVRTMAALAAVLTPATLEKIVNGLRFGWHHRQDPDAARARLAELMRAFITSTQGACRALAAQAFPLTLDARHHYREGEVSATRLVADTEVAVRVGLARNPHLRGLPENPDGLRVRQTLLQDPNPRVRTAARRAGVHVTSSHIEAAFAAAHGLPTIDDPAALDPGDALDDPAAAVRATAVAAGITASTGPAGRGCWPTRTRAYARQPPPTDSSLPDSSGPNWPVTPTPASARPSPCPGGPRPKFSGGCCPTPTRPSLPQRSRATRWLDRSGSARPCPPVPRSRCRSASAPTRWCGCSTSPSPP